MGPYALTSVLAGTQHGRHQQKRKVRGEISPDKF